MGKEESQIAVCRSLMSMFLMLLSEAGCQDRSFLPLCADLLLQLFSVIPSLLLFLVHHHVQIPILHLEALAPVHACLCCFNIFVKD